MRRPYAQYPFKDIVNLGEPGNRENPLYPRQTQPPEPAKIRDCQAFGVPELYLLAKDEVKNA